MMPPDQKMTEADRGCGQRLRAAREAAGLGVADVASRLKMPVRVVESLEAEDWSRLGAPVFVRGQLRSYAKLLGVSQEVRTTSVMAAIAPPVLTPRTYTTPMQRIAEQAARKLVYVVITAAIVVPIWLATREHLNAPAPDAASLDAPSFVPGTGTAAVDATGVSAPAQTQPSPLVASMAALPPRAQPAPPAAAAPAPASALTLRVDDESWLQVTAPDGRIVEETILQPGDTRSYAAGEIGGIVLGNARAAEVRRDGVVQDLSSFRRANVARFAISSDGSLAPSAQ